MNRHNEDDDSSDDDNVYYGGEEEDDDDDDDDYQQPNNNNNKKKDDYANPIPEEESPRRDFKYSTANMRESGNCKKWCLIFLMFLLMIAFMVALSMIFNHFFFGDVSDNAALTPERDENGTFSQDKTFIDQVCSSGTFLADEGRRCEEACSPQYFTCCDPFGEYEHMEEDESKLSAQEKAWLESAESSTFGDAASNSTLDLTDCTLDTELQGCMRYAKCQALGREVVPAPATLPVLCSQKHLDKDPVSCQELCKDVRCCYSDGTDNCIADNFDICSDYAPCQNLRTDYHLPTAPDDLDEVCFWQQPECRETCQAAKCCGDPDSTCFQNNFMACLTYAPCNDVSETRITLAPQFSVVPEPTEELGAACQEYHELASRINVQETLQATAHTCEELCTEVLCCWANTAADNCFFEDPLGCLTWEQQCQVLFQ